MTAIFTPPISLLDLLGTKAGGQNPDQLGPAVTPVLNLLRFLAAGRNVQIINGTAVPTAVGFWASAATTVPNNRAWLLLGSTVTGNAIGAGDTFQHLAGVSGDAVLMYLGAPITATSAQASGTRGVSAVQIAEPVLLLPGHAIGAYVTSAAAVTNCQLLINAAIVELLI